MMMKKKSLTQLDLNVDYGGIKFKKLNNTYER